jgi:arsenite-transporting ATPase
MDLMRKTTRHVFFTGKGGVGKTSVACATAVALADQGRKVLLVSTDPASNLDEVLGIALGAKPTPIPGAPGLSALNIDPEAAARDYREKLVGPYRGVLPLTAITSMEEQLSGSCTLEIAAFDEFSRLLGDPEATRGFDHVIFDTAPTGHTLRLLSLPSAWKTFIETNTSGTSCLGPLAGLKAQQALYRATVEALADASRTTVVLVSRPEPSALREAERSSLELSALGVANQSLVLNGLFREPIGADAVARAFAERAREALARMPERLAVLPREEIPLRGEPLLGIGALRRMLDGSASAPAAASPVSRAMFPPPLSVLVDDIARAGRGVVMAMGKGGVGKTTVAAAVALELARRGHRVRLSTTDPAAHLGWVLDQAPPGLTVGRIDPDAETRLYMEEVIRVAGAGLDDPGRALLEEDLRSPCTEEVAVFRAFAKEVAQGEDGFVVLDTAPTGHTILLLDAAEAYHREVLRQASGMPDAVRQLLPRLRDAAFTRILLVTLPEATPVHEAAALQADLVRAGIRPFAWVVNQSLAPLQTRDPLLSARRKNEQRYIEEALSLSAGRAALVPWLPRPPVGPGALAQVLGEPRPLPAVSHHPSIEGH